MALQLVGNNKDPLGGQGGPAFPIVALQGSTVYSGVSVRMWFAGMALAGGQTPAVAVEHAKETLALLTKKPQEAEKDEYKGSIPEQGG